MADKKQAEEPAEKELAAALGEGLKAAQEFYSGELAKGLDIRNHVARSEFLRGIRAEMNLIRPKLKHERANLVRAYTQTPDDEFADVEKPGDIEVGYMDRQTGVMICKAVLKAPAGKAPAAAKA